MSYRAPLLFSGIALAFAGSAAQAQALQAGYVATTTNAAQANELVLFGRRPNGTLTHAANVATGGAGTGAALGNQGGLIAGPGNTVYTVNAGSGTVSVLRIRAHDAIVVQVADAGGDRPISLTRSGPLLYVLNADGGAGGQDHINGFVIGPQGTLTPLAGSERPLSAASTGPAQIGFAPGGSFLVVTEKMTNLIDVFAVGPTGVATGVRAEPSEGMTPFGFGFDARGHLIVSEAFGGMPNASALSSYAILPDGTLGTITASAPTGQTAACWIARTAGSRFVYTTNTGSGSVSGFFVDPTGALHALTPGQATATTGGMPIDADTVANSYLYVLTQGTGAIVPLRIGRSGGLTPLNSVAGLPASATGLVAR